ncbi:DoxX family protein [Balneolales bacterium ANBcel1]|nr:DoxX family protein [Balneolales bacterium ANBcel1]
MTNGAGSSLEKKIVECRHCWIEGLRIFLGLLFVYKGIYFIRELELLYRIINDTMPISAFVVSHYVAFAHLGGGAMMIFGILTRIAVFVQMPIVIIGAVYFAGGNGSEFFGPTAELEYSLLIFILLVVYFFYGAGKWSVDHRVLRRKQENETEG